MIDWKTILSSFDDKPTLLQWLKIVEKALENASLENVAIKTTEDNKFVFEFKFADGSTVTSTPINFLKEISAIEKVSDAIVGTQTLTTLRVDYIDGTSDDFSVAAENGKDGITGKGVSSFEAISNEISGTKTLTTVRAHYTDGTSGDFSVAAENGKGIREMSNISNAIVGNQTVTTIRAFYTDDTSQDLSVYAQNGSGQTHIYMHKIAGVLNDSAGSGFNLNFLSSDNTRIESVPDFFEFFQHNKCYLFTADSYPLVYFDIMIFGNEIQIRGANIEKGTSIIGKVSKLIGDEVLTI